MVSLGLNSGLGFGGSRWRMVCRDSLCSCRCQRRRFQRPRPAFVADFRRDRHAVTPVIAANIAAASVDALVSPQSVPFSDLFVFTRGSVAEYIDAAGMAQQAAADVPRFDYRNGYRQLLLEGPATNLFVNAFTPATQRITVTNAAQYTVSCRGSGSLILAGAATATVTQAAPVTFTATSASLTLTVNGALTRAQLETGPAASSFVQTATMAATRNADSCRLSPAGEALIQRGAATFVLKGQGLYGSLGHLVGIGTGDEIIRFNTAQTNRDCRQFTVHSQRDHAACRPSASALAGAPPADRAAITAGRLQPIPLYR